MKNYNTHKESVSGSFTVDHAVDQLGFGGFQLMLTGLLGLAWVVDSMEVMLLAVLSSTLRCEWRLTAFQEAAITVTVFMGMLIGSTFWGKVADKYGRKFSLLLSSSVTLYFGTLASLSPGYHWILILRGLTGAGVAGAPQAITIYSEFIPLKHRSRAVICLELLPESVRYLEVTGNKEAVLKTLQQASKWNRTPMLLGELEVETDSKARGRFSDLFSTREYSVTTVLVWILWLVSSLAYTGVVLATTEIFNELSSTDEKCMIKATDLGDSCIAACEQLDTKDYVSILWASTAEFPGFVVAFLLLEVVDRKRALAAEFFLFALFVLTVSICMPRGWVTAALFASRIFGLAAYQTTYVYTAEVYPTTIRSLAMGTGSAFTRIGSMLTPFIAQVLLRNVSVRVAMGVYCLSGVGAALAALLLPIETRGRQMKNT
ncbi:synaptic vesicle 2-related protein-like isoform X2 [Symsagittifera roscoffensis]|uniref:synaptic vesicle 2-related protein-like isoform X2 n=1 Tax=Symsagittifera roscoffensis TaxID=84072 RepID=UPI00307C2ABA